MQKCHPQHLNKGESHLGISFLSDKNKTNSAAVTNRQFFWIKNKKREEQMLIKSKEQYKENEKINEKQRCQIVSVVE